MVKYYEDRLDQTMLLTGEEKQYIAQKKTMSVGYFDGYYPFSYSDAGQAAGLARQLLDVVAERTGIEFSYTLIEGMGQAIEQLQDGEIDILCYCGENEQGIKEKGVRQIPVANRRIRPAAIHRLNT